MSRLWTGSFEEGPGNLLLTGWTATAGTAPTVTTTAPHSGTYGLETASTAAQSAVYWALPTVYGEGKFTFTRFYIYGADMTPATATILCRCTSNSAVNAWTVTLNTDGTLTLTNTITTTARNTVAVLADSTRYRIEVYHLTSNTVGEIYLSLYSGDSTTAIETTTTITGEDTLSGTGTSRFYFGKSTAVAGTYHYDDIAINDTVDTDDNQTGMPGPGSCALLLAGTAATPTDWTPSSGTDHVVLLDDLPGGAPDDDTTYVSSSTAVGEWFWTTDLPAEVPSDATLVLAHVAVRATGVATTPDLRIGTWLSGGPGTAYGPTHTLTGSYAASLSSQRHVRDLTGYTKAQVNANTNLAVGFDQTTALACRVTALWMIVEWQAATGTNTDIIVPTTVYAGL